MRSDPGDELQVVHPLRFSGLFAMPIADLACAFIQGEPLQGQKRPDHVFAHPLGFSLCLGPDPAVDVESGMLPGENPLGPFGAEKLLADKIRENLVGEE